MQQLRLFFAMALLYMFRVKILPIIRSTMLYMAFQVGRYTYVVILYSLMMGGIVTRNM